MEKADLRMVNARERGAALVLVLLALLVMLPLALILSRLVLIRQRQVSVFRESSAGQFAVRGALAWSMARMRNGHISLGHDEATSFEFDELGSRLVEVHISRQPDAILTLDGEVVPPERALGLDTSLKGISIIGSADDSHSQDPRNDAPTDSENGAEEASGSETDVDAETESEAFPDTEETAWADSETPIVTYSPGKSLVRKYHRLEVYVVEAKTRAHVRLPAVRLLAIVARMEDGSVACLGVRYDRGQF
jgi:hypothetical protein